MEHLWRMAGKPRFSERRPETVNVHEEEGEEEERIEEEAGPSQQRRYWSSLYQPKTLLMSHMKLLQSFHQRIARLERLTARLSRELREVRNSVAEMSESLGIAAEGQSQEEG
uniref:Uncharacterized protein n=1 Tax=Sphaerodactylus townsendi TaxID=933632 RepID=A0ACB8G3A3_9SAUR